MTPNATPAPAPGPADVDSTSSTAAVVTIVDMLDDLAETRAQVSFGEIVDTLGAQGFGPLLLALAALLILPIGMIPGVGGVVGLATAAIGVQILRGRSGLWLPGPLRRRTLPSAHLKRACQVLRPRMLWLRQRLRPRVTVLAEGPISLRVIAVFLILAGFVMAALGAIPILPPLLGLPVLCFALGLTARDGAAVAAGYALLLPPFLVVLSA